VLTVSSRTETGIRRQPETGTLTLNDANPRLQAQKEWRLTDEHERLTGGEVIVGAEDSRVLVGLGKLSHVKFLLQHGVPLILLYPCRRRRDATSCYGVT
jgi:hypothetical protein